MCLSEDLYNGRRLWAGTANFFASVVHASMQQARRLQTHAKLREAAAPGRALCDLAEKDARNGQQLSTCKRFTPL
jgi:hypothetical protein